MVRVPYSHNLRLPDHKPHTDAGSLHQADGTNRGLLNGYMQRLVQARAKQALGGNQCHASSPGAYSKKQKSNYQLRVAYFTSSRILASN